MSQPWDAIVVGAGHNGLTCAAYLAKAGRRVLVLEKRHDVGGATSTEELYPGFHYSTCSYVGPIQCQGPEGPLFAKGPKGLRRCGVLERRGA